MGWVQHELKIWPPYPKNYLDKTALYFILSTVMHYMACQNKQKTWPLWVHCVTMGAYVSQWVPFRWIPFSFKYAADNIYTDQYGFLG